MTVPRVHARDGGTALQPSRAVIDPESVRLGCIADYKSPVRMELRDELPSSPTGKIRRKAL
jgi:hypothetical protein